MLQRFARFTAFAAFACVLVTLTLGALPAAAQSDGTADDRAASFQAVTGGVQEDVAGGPLMLGAYALVWLSVFGFAFRTNRLQRSVEANLERMERSITRQGTSAS